MLRLGGLGVRVGAASPGQSLVDTGMFRLGGAAGYVRTDLPLTGATALRRPATLDGAVSLEGLGLPFAGGDNSANPVAGSMLQPDPSGDAAPVNPPLDMLVGRGGGVWTVQFAGKAEVRFEINRSFGPLYIGELAFLYLAAGAAPGRVGISVDGGVSIAGLSVDVDDLSLLVPLDAPADLARWEVDLAGLSVGLVAGPVVVAGGLLKTTLADGTIDYEGMLSVDVAGRGFTAVGAYEDREHSHRTLQEEVAAEREEQQADEGVLLHQRAPLAGHGAHHLGRPGSVRESVLEPVRGYVLHR